MATDYKSFKLITQADEMSDSTLVIVGTALDGPTGVPFSLYSNVDPFVALGDSPLAEAYVAAREAGSRRVVAYRLNGTHSTAELKDRDGNKLMEFTSLSASDDTVDMSIVVFSTHIFVKKIDGTTRSYSFEKYPTVHDLNYAINRDAYYGLLDFNSVAVEPNYSFIANPLIGEFDAENILSFEGGSSEKHLVINRNPNKEGYDASGEQIPYLKERLKEALFGKDINSQIEFSPDSELGLLPYRYLSLTGLYVDDDNEIANIVGEFCKNKTALTRHGSYAILAVSPFYIELPDDGDVISEKELVHQKALSLVELSTQLGSSEGYKYIEVVVGEGFYAQSEDSPVSAAYAYAAALSLKNFDIMMTNKGINGFGKLNYELRKEDVALLAANGYTCIVPSIRKGFVSYYSTSFSKDSESPTSRPHNLRIAQHISTDLTENIDSLLGEPYSQRKLRYILLDADEIMKDYVKNELIISYELRYELLNDNKELALYVQFSTFNEVKAIEAVTTLSFLKGVS